MYVATADMSGLIKVWKVESGEEAWSFETSDLEVTQAMCNNLQFQVLTLTGLTHMAQYRTFCWRICLSQLKTKELLI